MRNFGKTRFASAGDAAAYLRGRSVSQGAAAQAGLAAAVKMVEHDAKAVIGTYERGWPPLKEATQAQRVRLGFTPNDPLLRAGELRDSISSEVEPGHGVVGSDSMIAVYQELGTSRGIPPRSFLLSTAILDEDKVAEMVTEALLVGLL